MVSELMAMIHPREKLCKRESGNHRSNVLEGSERGGRRKHTHLCQHIAFLLRQVKDVLCMMPTCPGSGGICLFLFPSVFLYVSLLGKLR